VGSNIAASGEAERALENQFDLSLKTKHPLFLGSAGMHSGFLVVKMLVVLFRRNKWRQNRRHLTYDKLSPNSSFTKPV